MIRRLIASILGLLALAWGGYCLMRDFERSIRTEDWTREVVV